MELLTPGVLDKVTAVAVLLMIALAVITDKLVWHTRLKKAEDRADRWEQIAMQALNAGAVAGLRAAEVTSDIVQSLPDPAKAQKR